MHNETYPERMERKDPHVCLRLLGREIRARREDQGLSQAKLALMINSGQSYIYRIETGQVNPGVDKLVRIANALDIDVSDLITF